MRRENQRVEESIESFSEGVVNLLKEGYHSPFEPFAHYATRMKHTLHRPLIEHQERLVKGYQILLRELDKPV